MDGKDILGPDVDLGRLRRRVGMVFQDPTTFPMSIYDNIAFGVNLHEHLSHADRNDRVEASLTRSGLWTEVKAKIEDLIDGLKQHVTIAIVTHNLQQAARCADQVAFMYLGEVIEAGSAAQIFTAPRQKRTQNYIAGRFG